MEPKARQIHELSWWMATFLSCLAFLTVLTGYTQPPRQDEGAGAHIFQLTIVALAGALVVFAATADWSHPLRVVKRLLIPAIATVLAFAAVWYLEHVRDPNYVGRLGVPHPKAIAKPSFAAVTVRSISSSECAVETTSASNCDGGT